MSVPADFRLFDITGSGVGVKLDEPKETNAIKRYEAFINGGSPEQACRITASAEPLVCKIRGLSSARTYIMGLKACVHGRNGCGAALEKSFRTG